MMKKILNDKLEMDQDTEAFLNRWSRKKHQSVKQDQDKEQLATESELKSEPPDLPDLDDLNETSDYSDFFHPDVDKELRKLALRKMFNLPDSQILDGLNEYDEDYTSFIPRGNIVTEEMKRILALAVENEKQEIERTLDPESVSNKESDNEDLQNSDNDN